MEFPPVLDITSLEPEFIKPDWPICPGYLDNVLAVFECHNHPFVLVSTLAMQWSGCRNLPHKEVDVLVRTAHLQVIIAGLVASGEWKISENWADVDKSMINNTPIRDIWLKSCIPDPLFEYLRFWPEELYKLSVDCNKLVIPDILSRTEVILEEEYSRDPYGRFGPQRIGKFSKPKRPLLPIMQLRAKIMRRDIPIFIPTVEEHLNALLDQLKEERKTKLRTGNIPEWQIKNFIRYLCLDWTPTREWILSSKIRKDNVELMTERLDKYQRKLLILWDRVLGKWVFDKMPWELSIGPEFQQSAEGEAEGS